jgi:hypothetical protein
MGRTIHISELVASCITRDRGKEAVTNLRKYINSDPIVVDLTNVDIVSFSFLDELVFWLKSSGVMSKVIFRFDQPTIYDKLSRIVGIRNAWVFFQDSNNEIHEMKPKAPRNYHVKFIDSRTKLNGLEHKRAT